LQKRAEHQAVENAIESGDYTAFKNAMIAQIPSEAEFQKMVAAHKARTESQVKIETAVKNNDFTAFKAAIEEQKANMASNHPGMGNDTPKALSNEKLQKHFDTLVEYYKTNGKLPEMGKGFGACREGVWVDTVPVVRIVVENSISFDSPEISGEFFFLELLYTLFDAGNSLRCSARGQDPRKS
jgi:hypothetical protein